MNNESTAFADKMANVSLLSFCIHELGKTDPLHGLYTFYIKEEAEGQYKDWDIIFRVQRPHESGSHTSANTT